jgi:transposase-like protein
MEKTTFNREAIIAEYLTGETTFRQLAAKHGVDFRTIHYWVSSYKGKIKPKVKLPKSSLQPEITPAPLPADVKNLQAELHKAKLHAEVLEEMLKLSEDLTGIELRKKFGAKRF